MGCENCIKRSFVLSAGNRDITLLGLDQCVLAVYISFPENDDDVFEMMWEQVVLYNPDFTAEKEGLRQPLVEFYYREKDNLGSYITRNDCMGC